MQFIPRPSSPRFYPTLYGGGGGGGRGKGSGTMLYVHSYCRHRKGGNRVLPRCFYQNFNVFIQTFRGRVSYRLLSSSLAEIITCAYVDSVIEEFRARSKDRGTFQRTSNRSHVRPKLNHEVETLYITIYPPPTAHHELLPGIASHPGLNRSQLWQRYNLILGRKLFLE